MRDIPVMSVTDRLRTENPWWEDSGRSARQYAEMKPRPYQRLFAPLVTDRSVRRAVVLLGPRRVGKTVMIHHAIQELLDADVSPKSILYASIDHPLYNGLSLDQILTVYAEATGCDPYKEETFLFFDEIQYFRNWESHVKALVDGCLPAKCIVSGSAAAALRLKSVESGAGRFTDFMLPPLTFYEYTELTGKQGLVEHPQGGELFGSLGPKTDIGQLNEHFLNYLNFGGYPELALSPTAQSDPARFVKNDIIDKVLLRDLPGLYGIQDVQELNYLFTTLAFNTAGEVSLEELSKKSGVAKNTITRYLKYLEAAFLIRIVHRVDRDARRFQRANRFKVYLTNPSIYAALFSPVAEDHESMGALTETAIFAQWFHASTTLYYARWKEGEVDIVALGPEQKASWAVEVKWSDRCVEDYGQIKNILKFCKSQGLKRCWVTTRTRSVSKQYEGINVEFVPAALYCYVLGYNNILRKTHNS